MSSATVDHLDEKFKFLESASTLDDVGLPFPRKGPTKSRFSIVNVNQMKEMVGTDTNRKGSNVTKKSIFIEITVVERHGLSVSSNSKNRQENFHSHQEYIVDHAEGFYMSKTG